MASAAKNATPKPPAASPTCEPVHEFCVSHKGRVIGFPCSRLGRGYGKLYIVKRSSTNPLTSYKGNDD